MAGMLALLVAGNAGACVTEPPRQAPDVRQLARAADIVAIVHVDHVVPLTAQELAERDRLFTTVSNGPFVPPAASVRFSVRRMLKGRIAAGTLIRNGATSCEVILAEGGDYVLFAMQPIARGDRISPMDGTFQLDKNGRHVADLDAVEFSLTHFDLTQP